MTKKTAKLLIVGIAAALILYTISGLFGRHYYHTTFGYCLSAGIMGSSRCLSWTLQAAFQTLAICVAAVVAWVYNESRRSQREP